MKVLVVDDNKIMTTILRMMIEKKNHQVITANDGEDGYATYLNFRPDLVLTDIQMPGKNGFELVTMIREHNPSVMVIYMTGDPGRFLTQLKEEQYTHKVDFICKPFSVAELSTMLSKHRVLPKHQD